MATHLTFTHEGVELVGKIIDDRQGYTGDNQPTYNLRATELEIGGDRYVYVQDNATVCDLYALKTGEDIDDSLLLWDDEQIVEFIREGLLADDGLARVRGELIGRAGCVSRSTDAFRTAS